MWVLLICQNSALIIRRIFFAIHHSPLSPACLIQDAVERKHLYLTCSFTLDSFLLLLTQYYIVIEEHGGGGGHVCV